MTKDDIAARLDEIGTLLALKGENDFKVRAYHAASRTISQLEDDINQLVAAKKLGTVRGIGEALVEKITTLAATGKLPYLEELRASVPAGMIEILKLPGVGPKKVKALHDALGIDTLDKLRAACESGEVAKLKGFGEKTAQKILDGITFLGTVGNRVRFDKGFALGERLLEKIRAFPGVIRAELCGSLRRRRETVKDIDIVCSAKPKDAEAIMAAFVKLPEVMQVIGTGPTKSSVVAEMALGASKIVLNADLRVVTDEQFPVAVLHFTGSKEHNIRLRQRAIDRGFSLNEYALTGWTKKLPDEAAIYKVLDLVWVPPELREDMGEIDAAEKNQLPTLVEVKDIRGVFHNHTTESDGTATLEEMAAAAQELGLEYLGIADHSMSLTIANGLSPTRLKRQCAEIDALNMKLKGLTILKGSEVDILEDGSLDFSDEVLAMLDYVVVSVHTLFGLSEEAQTARVCKALSHPAVTMLGHATGRLLLRREGYKIDLDRVLEAAARHGKMIEINAQPDRLDLDWKYVKRAKALGIPLVINPDAHSTDGLGLYVYGVNVARRGWLTKADVFNTRSAADVLKELARRKTASRAP